MKKYLKLLLTTLLIVFVYSCSDDDDSAADKYLDREAARQAAAYLNEVRADPPSYSAEIGVDLSGVAARQALNWNETLAKVAEEKALDMAVRDYFAHVDPDGDGINILIHRAGYALEPQWYADQKSNYFESIAAGYYGMREATGPDLIRNLIVDEGVPSLGHRKHLLGIDDWNASLVDYGIGFARKSDTEYKNYMCVIIAKHSD